MKWIGQHIVDFIARFRSDVYLEGITTSTETDMLVVDSNNKVSKRAIDAITVDVSDFMTNGVDNRVVTATGADALNAESGLTWDGSTLVVDGDAEATSFTGLWDGGTIPIAKGGTGVTSSTTWLNSKITSKADGTFNYDGTTAVAPNHDSLAGFVSAEHVDWAGASAGTIHSSNIPTLNQNTTGSAATLTTPRTINGVNFDGSGPITVPAAGSTLSDTVTVANGGTGLTTVGANQILTGNATGALTSEANFTFGVDRLHIGADDEITPQIRFQNDENTVTVGIADSADNLITGSADGDFVINSTGDHNILFGQNNAVALTVNTDGDVVTAGDLKVNGTDIYGPTDGDMNLRSDGNIALFLDGDNDESSLFKILNSASGTVFSVTEAGVGALNGEYIVTGGKVNVASEAQAPIGMQIARRTITTAEANAMHSTPIEVVPAQGVNTIIVPINCLTRVDRAANQTESVCDMNAHYADKEPGVYNTASLFHWRRFMFGETTDHSEMRGTTGATSGVTLTESVNKGIELSFDSAATTDCFTSIDIFMTYYVIDIS